MNTKPPLILISIFCFLLVPSFAQEKPKKCQLATTDSKKLIGTIKLNEQETIEIIGKATYTVTALNSDESLVGTLFFALADAERQKIAQAMNKELSDVPMIIREHEAIGQFHKLTECPRLQFDFPAMDLEIAGAKMQLKPFILNLKKDDDLPTFVLCKRAWRIANGLDRRADGRRLNRILNCTEEN